MCVYCHVHRMQKRGEFSLPVHLPFRAARRHAPSSAVRRCRHTKIMTKECLLGLAGRAIFSRTSFVPREPATNGTPLQ